MDGFSAHADYSQMEEWLQHLTMYNAKQVFVVHGEATASKAVKEMIEEEFGWNAYIPFYADRAIMTKNTCEIKAANIPQVSVEKIWKTSLLMLMQIIDNYVAELLILWLKIQNLCQQL